MGFQSPPMPVARKRVKMVSCLSRDWLAFQPMAMRFTVYSPVLVTMPARMEGTPSLVWRKAVTNPAQGPGQHGGGDGQEGVSRGGEGHRHGAAQDETAVGGQVGDVQHPVA